MAMAGAYGDHRSEYPSFQETGDRMSSSTSLGSHMTEEKLLGRPPSSYSCTIVEFLRRPRTRDNGLPKARMKALFSVCFEPGAHCLCHTFDTRKQVFRLRRVTTLDLHIRPALIVNTKTTPPLLRLKAHGNAVKSPTTTLTRPQKTETTDPLGVKKASFS